MPRRKHLRVRKRASLVVDTESPHSNNESDTISPEVENWGTRRLGMSRASKSRSTLTRPRYHSPSEDDDDELVFTPLDGRRRGKSTRNVQNQEAKRRLYEEQEEHQEDSYSIRRSTRQRKLKYDNYNDSWIVGSQTVKGYPCYVNTSHSKIEKIRRRVVKTLPNLSPPLEDDDEEEEEVEEGGEDEVAKEEQPRRIRRKTTSKDDDMRMLKPRRVVASRAQEESSEEEKALDETKEEPLRKRQGRKQKGTEALRIQRTRRASQRLEEVSSEDMDVDDIKEVQGHRLRRNKRPPQRLIPNCDPVRRLPRRIPQQKKKQPKEEVKSESEDEIKVEEEEEGDKPKVEKTEDDDGNESDSSSVTSENKDAGSGQDQSFQDMYARVKQRRRNNAQITPVTGSGEDSRMQHSANKTGKGLLHYKKSESSSGEMSDGMVGRRMRRPSQNRKTYHLRQIKPTVNRFQISQPKIREVLNVVRRKRAPRRRRWSSSSSSDSSRDDRYDRKKSKAKSSKSMALAGTTGSTSKPETTGLLADVDPLALDTSIRFSNVGGLESHIDCLKEMVVFPMLYKDIFEKFNVTPPKGVLFHGPPGTGKTLMARALANECSQGSRKVSFFMRKGADCLSKWVGESERQLRLLFEEAKQARPSIIFFDELDGLAPVRSSKQDQIHASIVCTLLALMDGLDNRGDIIVIGATNRIDSIDPALRRPGRFDRELYFPLPGLKERREILGIHTKGWSDDATLSKMAEESWGYCGSDLKALCSEAIIQAMKRVFPQIYLSSQKLQLDPDKVKVERLDFMRAKRGIVPASKRGVCCMSRRLPKYLEPLLNSSLEKIYSYISSVFPHNGSSHRDKVVRNPRLVLSGERSAVMTLAGAILHKLEHCSVLSVSLESIHSEATVSPEEAISRVFKEVPQRPGAVLWMGDISLWWQSLSDLSRNVFMAHVDSLDPTLPVLMLAVSTSTNIPSTIRNIFSQFHGEIQFVDKPTEQQKKDFYTPLLKEKAVKPPIIRKKPEELEALPVAPPSPPRPLTKVEEDKFYFEEENTLRELRIFLRQICAKLARNKQFYMFSKPVDINEVPDYLNIINEPMDLETMMTKIDLHKYTCAQDFLNDIDLLCRNALEYNPDKDPEDKLIRHRACYLRDTAYALIKAEMDSDFEINCRTIRDKRKDRGSEYGTARFVREFFPDHQMEEDNPADGNEQDVRNSPASHVNLASTTTIVPLNTQNNQGMDEGNSGGGSASLNSDSKKRKRRHTWSKGLIKRKKASVAAPLTPATSAVTNHVSEGSSSAVQPGFELTDECVSTAVHSTPLKTPSKKCKLDSEGISSVSETVGGNDVLANGDISSCSSDVTEPLSRKDETMILTEQSFHTESNNSGGEKQLLVDYKGLDGLLEKIVSLSISIESYRTLIDLYVALERVIRSYLRKWNRTNLVKDLKDVLQKFIDEYRPCNEDSCSDVSNEETERISQAKSVMELSGTILARRSSEKQHDNVSSNILSSESIHSDRVLPTKISSEDENAVSSYRPELVVAENACVDSELQTLDEISTRLDLREEIPSVKRWDDRASVSSNHQDLLDTENSSVNKDLRTLDSISTELHSRECILADIDNDSMSTDI